MTRSTDLAVLPWLTLSAPLKHFGRVTARYDIAANFLAMVQLALSRLRLRAHESTA
jgi:hypothetical protein